MNIKIPDGKRILDLQRVAAETATSYEDMLTKTVQAAVREALESVAKDAPHLTPSAKWRAAGATDPHGTAYDCERALLAMGTLTDDELANGAFMNYNVIPSMHEVMEGHAFMPIVWMTAVKERVRWLSRSLEKALATNPDVVIDTCAEQGHKFAKLSNHPTRDGAPQCPNCMSIGLSVVRRGVEQKEREKARVVLNHLLNCGAPAAVSAFMTAFHESGQSSDATYADNIRKGLVAALSVVANTPPTS